MSRLDDLVCSNPVPGWRGLAWIVVALLISAVAWAYQARMEEFATAPGEVVPRGQVKVVQHLEGGILRRIDVEEGQMVAAGDVLAVLDLGATALNRDELRVQLDASELRRSRLQAEAAGTAIALPAEVARRRPRLARSERETYDSRQRQLASALEVLRRQRRQRELEVRELEAKRGAVRNSLELARQRLEISLGLLRGKLVSRMEHLALEAEVKALEGDLAQLAPPSRGFAPPSARWPSAWTRPRSPSSASPPRSSATPRSRWPAAASSSPGRPNRRYGR
jgi:adhesin transport system membrane fusion protein